MNSSNRQRVGLGVAVLGGAVAFAVACGGGNDATTISGTDGGSDSGELGTDSGQTPTDSGAEDVKTDASNVTDAGQDATAVDSGDAGHIVNPDGGCDPVQDGLVFVDPNAGDDDTSSPGGYLGGSLNASCAFKTITKAVAYVGATPAVGTKIVVHGLATVSTGETFPITVPTNVTIVGFGGKVTVNPGNSNAFILNADASGLDNLTLVNNASAPYGVVADTGSTTATAITNVDASGFLSAGFLVQNTGMLTIVPGANGVHSTANGAGIVVSQTGALTITAPTGVVAFNTNTGAGISVQNTATVAITGVANTAVDGTGTVIANSNGAGGLAISSTAASTVTGLVAFSNTGDGIGIGDNGNLVLRKSQSFKNTGNGFHVTKTATLAATDVTKIDLGKAKDGLNVLQVTAANKNASAGLCFDTAPLVTKTTLSAQGNTFSGVDCSKMTVNVTDDTTACSGGVDVGLGNVNNAVDITMCALP